MTDILSNLTPTNPTIKRGETKVSISYIICAAIWYQNDAMYMHQPVNVKKGFVVTGRRHHNCFMTSSILSDKSMHKRAVENKWNMVQGFVTSDDMFVDREYAGEIAFKAGQTDKIRKLLFSEDLY